jgi:hypothetical protein
VKPLNQSLEELLATLTEMDADWLDPAASKVIDRLALLALHQKIDRDVVRDLLEADFETGITIVRLFLDVSKDRLADLLPGILGPGGVGVKRFRQDEDLYLDALEKIDAFARMEDLVQRPLKWTDILVERLKGGRGRAIRGQRGGRSLEDFVEHIVSDVFGKGGYEARCSFVGRDGKTTAKADFVVPNRTAPRIIMEAKGYAATGSKQTDVIGDLTRIISAKRTDSSLLLVTDGLTWRRRVNDLRTIMLMQNRGEIARVYTRAMASQMKSDLEQLGREHGIL